MLASLQHQYNDFPTSHLNVALNSLDNVLVFLIFPKSYSSFSTAFSYSLTDFVNLRLSPLKHQKVKKTTKTTIKTTTTKIDKYITKKAS